MKNTNHPVSIYLHIPFCSKLCSYCDFNTYERLDKLIPEYTNALVREIEIVSESSKDVGVFPIRSVYFGGGTPSLLPIHLIQKILISVRRAFNLNIKTEITIEANPDTVDRNYLTALHEQGVNRISIGVQSAQTEELRLLDRMHSFKDVVKVVHASRTAAFNNMNLDLIYGLPKQRIHHWEDTLHKAVELQPQHLSLYALTLEHGSPLRAQVTRGLLPTPESDLAADMYECASKILSKHGFIQYEISNWAHKSGEFACQHNLQYWKNLPYLAFGAGAHGWFNGCRYSNTRSPQLYIDRMKLIKPKSSTFPFSPAVSMNRKIDRKNEMNETLMMGLRLLEGVPRHSFQERFGVTIEHEYFATFERLATQGLITPDRDRVRLSKVGRLLGNRVFSEFV